jgi:hypothetical protein
MDYHANPVAAMKRAQVGTVGCNVSIRMHRASTVERKLKVPWKDGSSALAVTGLGWVLRQQCGGLLTMAASSDPTAASSICELTLPTPSGRLMPDDKRLLSLRLRPFNTPLLTSPPKRTGVDDELPHRPRPEQPTTPPKRTHGVPLCAKVISIPGTSEASYPRL